ncbi:hypothetical protein [Planococcus salinus]|nr:hypothetical protein [Planococcus salinus]
MGIGRIVRTAIKVAPVAYPIIRKITKGRKKNNANKDSSQQNSDRSRRR